MSRICSDCATSSPLATQTGHDDQGQLIRTEHSTTSTESRSGIARPVPRLVGGGAEGPELAEMLSRLGFEAGKDPDDGQPSSSAMSLAVVSSGATPNDYRAALRMGADAIVEVGASLTQLGWLLESASAGFTALPSSVVRALATRLADPPQLSLDERDIHLLHRVAEGATVTTIANELDISERHVRRLLNHLWRVLQSQSRLPGVVIAARWGLLEDPAPNRPGQHQNLH